MNFDDAIRRAEERRNAADNRRKKIRVQQKVLNNERKKVERRVIEIGTAAVAALTEAGVQGLPLIEVQHVRTVVDKIRGRYRSIGTQVGSIWVLPVQIPVEVQHNDSESRYWTTGNLVIHEDGTVTNEWNPGMEVGAVHVTLQNGARIFLHSSEKEFAVPGYRHGNTRTPWSPRGGQLAFRTDGEPLCIAGDAIVDKNVARLATTLEDAVAEGVLALISDTDS
ncbi:hypothetical protein [Actinokineospora spheciospongiae]|uniref:hypothetical protein n=1 Tax=Actinokineospora spheciospongiae TaxID=909613 RepID=UPI00126793F9|nr:hypothetical protein [Actinokineospora spheciospongiae]